MKELDEVIFDRESYTLLLPIEKESFVTLDYVQDKALELNLSEKDEYHITIFGFGAGKKIEDALRGEARKIEDFIELVNGTAGGYELKDEFYSIKKTYKIMGVPEERRSVIMMVRVPELEEFFDRVNRLLGTNLEVPPTHITLYTKSSLLENNQTGIGISSSRDFLDLKPSNIASLHIKNVRYSTIALPTRPQPDTIVAIFILKKLGSNILKGVDNSEYLFIPRLPDGTTDDGLLKQGILPIDIGGGAFDHHNKSVQTTASNLVADFLDERENPALAKLLQYAERDDFHGKGTISTDSLDRAFGLSGLIASLNRKYVQNPQEVIDILLPILEAHFEEEWRRAFEMPKELEEKLSNGLAQVFNVRQRGKNLKCIFVETDNTSMAGFLRSKLGGGFDIVALRLSSGHVNILTKPAQKIDLRSLVVIIRIQEAESRRNTLDGAPHHLAISGVLDDVPQWYYDQATNSLLNGGPNPNNVESTAIDPGGFVKILEVGLSEKLWAPAR
jgi:hypothetical protein